MRRRDLLATVATAGVVGTAGCGYAHGGGDVRDDAHVGGITAGLDAESFHALDGDRLVLATSGRQMEVVDGETSFVDVTEVTVRTLGGDWWWSYTHRERARGLTVGADAYLLDGNGDLVAVAATEVDGRTSSGDGYETGVRWRAGLEDPRPPLSADGRGVYVARKGGLLAVREGTVEWSVDLPGTPGSLLAVDGGVVASTPDAVVGLPADGRDRWRVDAEGTASLAAAGERVVLRYADRLRAVRATDGGDPWTVDFPGSGPLATTEDVVYAASYGRVHAFEAGTGNERWATDSSHVRSSPLVAAPEGVYVVEDCEAVAVDGDGERWSRELDVQRDCSPVAGWLHGETVAFLLESGAGQWLQRTDQPAPGSV